MRKLFVLVLILSFSLALHAQDDKIRELVKEGIVLHDKGDYEEAIKKYDEALALDKDHFDANYEKAITCLNAKKLSEGLEICRKLMKLYPAEPALKNVYSACGSIEDDMGRADDAIKTFNEGIRKFPDFFLLHFNKGLTYMRQKKNKEALESYAASLKLHPYHPSSNYYTALILHKENKIPAFMAYLVFIAVEPQSKRSQDAFTKIDQIMYGHINRDGKNVTISISADLFSDNKKNKNVENDFSSVEFIFNMLGAMQSDDKKLIDSEAAKFDLKLQMVANSLSENKKKAKGFYWTHYVPFFEALKRENYTIIISHLLFHQKEASSQAWLDENGDKVKAFYEWLDNYKWKG